MLKALLALLSYHINNYLSFPKPINTTETKIHFCSKTFQNLLKMKNQIKKSTNSNT